MAAVNDDARPDPDVLLARLERQATQAARGRLRIYFGASAGVGKTFAMLSAARQEQGRGSRVLVGAVETHGRGDTAALLDGLEILPRRDGATGAHVLPEFDLDGAIARRPDLLVVDELAHSNVAGSRHPKRWQDIEELLAAGIDVYTAMNVQHLESLNDVVGGITGVRVRETVPDRFFDAADEVVLVDLTPDDLLARLEQGKVYLGEQAARAAQNFFRKGNLIALRELALRRVADRVDVDMREWRREQSVEPLWRAGASLLACVGPAPGNDNVVRAAGRIASQMGVAWEAVFVETPPLQQLPEPERRRILKVLQLAESLGARTTTMPGQDAAAAIAAHVRSHNFARVVVGRSNPKRFRFRRARFPERLGQLAPDVELITVPTAIRSSGRDTAASDASTTSPDAVEAARYAKAATVVAAVTLTATPLRDLLDLSNIVMLFLLAVVGVALRWGRGPAALAAVLSVAAFDFFFVPPRYTFAVSDVEYLVTFAVMLTVGLVVGQLMSGLRYQARVAISRERRMGGLYALARELSGALTAEQVSETVDRFAADSFHGRTRLLLPDANDEVRPADGAVTNGIIVDTSVAQWVHDRGEPAGIGTDTLPGGTLLYLPLRAPMRNRGALAVDPGNPRWAMVPEQRRLFETVATLAAIALERIHYVDVARDALVDMESERIRNALLASISHDLRTPLAGILGAATSLVELEATLTDAQRRELTRSIVAESRRMVELVNNVLQMARLESGQVHAVPQWITLDELVGSALRALERPLADHPVSLHLPATMTLAHVDPLLFDQLLINLLGNATRHTPRGTPIDITAARVDDRLELEVADRGPGLGAVAADTVFEKFRQGRGESAEGGVGLGLSICRAVARLHGGTVTARNREGGGASFAVSVPQPPLPAALPAEVA
ncbi:MAG: DUF4118 domain-containing protein [Burkholderiales bacterium]|nr:DUF4118 domain-containing protein [Burkholderiales bacterium]